jgi:membrane protein
MEPTLDGSPDISWPERTRRLLGCGRERLAARLTRPTKGPSFVRMRILARTVCYLFGREATVLVSSISFSFFLSVFPFIVLLLTFANYLHWEALREAVFNALYAFFPISQDFIVRNLRIYTQSFGHVTVVSGLLLLWAGSTFFFAFEAGLDSAYRVTCFRHFVFSQLIGTVMTGVYGLLAFVAIVTLNLAHDWTSWAGLFRVLLGINVSVGLTFILFFSLYYYLPNRNRNARQVLPETLLATVVWIAAHMVFRFLAPSWSLQSIYGPFYISVTLLLWGYVLGCVVLGSARLSAEKFFAALPEESAEAVA